MNAGLHRSTPDPVHAGAADRYGGWSWRQPGRGKHYRTCSYCGSTHPQDLATDIGEGAGPAEWADRKYGWPHKLYVDLPNRHPGELFVLGTITQATVGPSAPGGENYLPPGPEYVAWDDLTAEQLEIVERDGHSRTDYVRFDTRTAHHAKFYSTHLADPKVADDVKETIARWSGLVFAFEDGQVRWRAFDYDGEGA